MSEECGTCEYNRQCFIKKTVGIYECEKINTDEYPIEEQLEEVMKLNQEQVKIIEDLQQKVEQLENIRKEAIESIEDCKKVNGYDGICTIDYNHLLNILNKGSNNEESND